LEDAACEKLIVNLIVTQDLNKKKKKIIFHQLKKSIN